MSARRYNRSRARRDELRTEGQERQAYRDGLTDQQQLARLDSGHYTATKERARLNKRIEKVAGWKLESPPVSQEEPAPQLLAETKSEG